MAKLRKFKNVSELPLEIHEVGKKLKHRVRVNKGETSDFLKVTDELTDYLTNQTGFAVVVEEKDEDPAGAVPPKPAPAPAPKPVEPK